MSVEDAALSGDQMSTLRALRDRLAQAIDESSSAMGVAALGKQLQDVLDRIAELTPPDIKDTPLDELKRRRAERQGGADSATGS